MLKCVIMYSTLGNKMIEGGASMAYGHKETQTRMVSVYNLW